MLTLFDWRGLAHTANFLVNKYKYRRRKVGRDVTRFLQKRRDAKEQGLEIPQHVYHDQRPRWFEKTVYVIVRQLMGEQFTLVCAGFGLLPVPIFECQFYSRALHDCRFRSGHERLYLW